MKKDKKIQTMNQIKQKLTKNDIFQRITKKDDAFHGPKSYPSAEWWYFDSILNNDYSIHIGFRILSLKNLQILKPSINIYQKSNLIAHETKLIPKKYFSTSVNKPLLEIENKSVMYADDSENTDEDYWTYHINYKLNNVGVSLKFKGVTEGWKYETINEGWTVSLPQASVSGKIFFNNETVAVKGTGYHDHNWNFSLKTPARGWAWYWGKIRSKHFNLSWANIKKTGILKQTFLERFGVLNFINGSFEAIDVENISISADTYILKDSRKIPTKFHIYAKQDDILIDVDLETISIHRTQPSALTIHYWRYFVKVSGIIKKGNTTDEIHDVTQIMEFMRFI
jgi:hypothetical protein